ncbi:MAG: hypothetical protein KBT12_03975 [Bacteroidales bacterium]|nr:hypothetical protein [Candidatus Physcousia equi]
MKVFNYLAAAVVAIVFSACGNSNSVTLKIETDLGELGNYVTSSDQEVTIQLTEEKDGENVCKTLVSSLALNVNKSVASDYSFDLEADVLDKNHVKIASLPDFDIESHRVDAYGEMDHALYTGSIRAQMRFEIDSWDEAKQQMWDKIRTDGVYIQIRPSHHRAHYVGM